MPIKGFSVISGLLWIAIFPCMAKAQSQGDINNLNALIPWAEKLDQRRAEQREREGQQILQRVADMEQAIAERDQLAATLLAERTARAKAIKTWNPKAYPPPPLFPGESLVHTLNGCGLLLPLQADASYDYPAGYDTVAKKPVTKKMTHRAYYATLQWDGDCTFGLAEGLGSLSTPEQMVNAMAFQYGYLRGRTMNFYLSESPENGTGQYIMMMGQDKPGDQVSLLVRDDPFAGLWSNVTSNAPRTALRIQESGKGSYVATDVSDCTTFEVMYKKKIEGCSYSNDFPVYSIVQGVGMYDANPKVTLCPNMKSSDGCEALWQQLAGPTIARNKADWETASAKMMKERERIESFSAAWRAPLEKSATAKQYTAIAGIEKTFKSNPKALTDAQLAQLRAYYVQNAREEDIDRLDQFVNQRDMDREVAAQSAQQAADATRMTQSKSNIRAGACSTYEQCVQVENASGLSTQLNAIPGDNVNLKTRGIIAASEFMVSNYQQCLPDKRCQTLINQYRQTRADTLVVCQKVSTDASSCTISPF